MSKHLVNGATIDLAIDTGRSLTVNWYSGTYSASIVAGGAGVVVLATNATTDQTFGPYASGRVIRLSVSAIGRVVYDAGTTPVMQAYDAVPSYVVSPAAPVNADGRPDGTVYIQSAS